MSAITETKTSAEIAAPPVEKTSAVGQEPERSSNPPPLPSEAERESVERLMAGRAQIENELSKSVIAANVIDQHSSRLRQPRPYCFHLDLLNPIEVGTVVNEQADWTDATLAQGGKESL